MAAILDKMCYEFCTNLHIGYLSHYKPPTHSTLKSMWFTQEQKTDFNIVFFFFFFWGGGGDMNMTTNILS